MERERVEGEEGRGKEREGRGFIERGICSTKLKG